MGTLSDGSAGRIREHDCDMQTCVQRIDDGTDQFLRIEDFPTTTTVNYTNANVSEDIDGADGDPIYGGQTYPGAWTPSYQHPVTVEARLRFSANYHKDGSGGAKGTAGLWLWNNPFSQGFSDPFSNYNGIGFSWASTDSVLVNGLNTTVVIGAKPVTFSPVLANININDWNTYKFVWSQDLLGNQYVTFYINGCVVGAATLPVGVLAQTHMGLEFWADDQQFTLSGINKIPITEHQFIDMDYIAIQKN
jgi:hypothetical protein